MTGRPDPARVLAVLVMREPEDVGLSLVVVTDQRTVMARRAERVVDNRAENLILDPGFKVHLAPLASETHASTVGSSGSGTTRSG